MARTEEGASNNGSGDWLTGTEMPEHKGLGFMTLAESPLQKGFNAIKDLLSNSTGLASRVFAFAGLGAAGGTTLAMQDTPAPDPSTADVTETAPKAGETEKYVAKDNLPAEQHAQVTVPAPDASAEDLSKLSPASGPGETVTVKIEPLSSEQNVAVGTETQTPVVAQVDSHTSTPVIAEAPPSSGMGTADLVAAGGITLALAGGTQLTVDDRQSDKLSAAADTAKADIIALYDQLCQSVGISRDKGFAACEANAEFDKVPQPVTVAKVEQRGAVIG